MNNNFITLDLNSFHKAEGNWSKEHIIEAKKKFNGILKESRKNTKTNTCYYCNNPCASFCNSHTLPAFCLKNIAHNGKVLYSNSIAPLPLLNIDKGVKESGTFHLICQKCDSMVFQDYENPDNYNEIPSIKMLAQIDIKNNLKNISKRLIESELYNLMPKAINLSKASVNSRKISNNLDLNEFINSFKSAKKRELKPFQGDYYIGFYKKLSYVVPVGFQGTVALAFDIDGNIINNLYNKDPKYIIQYVSLCIFPLEKSSVIMLFVNKKNNRYGGFFKQLRKYNEDEQLNIINYILFAYCEDYFLSPCLSDSNLEQLIALTGKTPVAYASYPMTSIEQMSELKKTYDYNDRFNAINLLSEQYKIQ